MNKVLHKNKVNDYESIVADDLIYVTKNLIQVQD